MFGRLVLLVSLVASGMAKPFITSPVEGTVCSGGSTCNINWQEDNDAPLLAEFGDASVGLFVGSVSQQTMLQNISDSVNVATTASIAFTVDPSAGPDDSIYFIRFDSLTSRNGTAPNQSFSAKFTLNGMSGTFNSTVQAQINAAASGAASSTSAATSSGLTSSSTSKTASSTASASSAAASANAAGRVGVANGLVSAAGAAAALFALAL
ncbi:hypothetical protein A7U60_g3653 [Sanghuangporus baumii]|uniref:Yeast cell wall synthesis Kre9/Knh1-like N-terminal domain-containing protein n=1 Tax=Sanghuangporus baumii TaxID=108892 RepID=A0A9Q5I002_SANBA|nr:hypothetical protein A7U60_g3653 [Sanghuangporus baumii]